jgi:hypothetical protein
MNSMVIFHSYVAVYQRVSNTIRFLEESSAIIPSIAELGKPASVFFPRKSKHETQKSSYQHPTSVLGAVSFPAMSETMSINSINRWMAGTSAPAVSSNVAISGKSTKIHGGKKFARAIIDRPQVPPPSWVRPTILKR